MTDEKKIQIIDSGIDALIRYTMLDEYDSESICASLRSLAFVKTELLLKSNTNDPTPSEQTAESQWPIHSWKSEQ